MVRGPEVIHWPNFNGTPFILSNKNAQIYKFIKFVKSSDN